MVKNFAKRSTVISSSSMEQTAKQITRQSNKNPDIFGQAVEVAPDVYQSMVNQQMVNTSAWSPGSPIEPENPVGTEPRQFEYMIGQNIVQRPRSTEAIGFDTMRSIIESYDIAQMCIEVRQDELRNLDWNIVPFDEEEANKYDSEIRMVRRFFEKPDGNTIFDEWQNICAYDWLAFDALTIYPHMTKGGKLGALEIVDGTTITPMVDYYGRQPLAPAPAFVQWINGMPWTWLNRDQLIYTPHRRRSNKLYGFSPIEWLMQAVNTDIRHQIYFLQYFTEGSVPEAWIEAPESIESPEQIAQLQTMYDAVMSGKQSMKHKAKFIPFGSKVTMAKDASFDVNFPQFLLTKVCAAFKVTPAELGFTEKVNKSSGETQENVQFRRSIRPSAKFFESIYTGIIAKYFGLPNLKFKFLNLDEQEDMLAMAQRDQIYIANGVISPDEVRVQRLGLEVDINNPVPRGFITHQGFTPAETAIENAIASVEQTKASVAQSQAQAESLKEQTRESQLAAGEDPKQIEAEEKKDDTPPKQGNDDGVAVTIEEERTAEKAMLDFFPKAEQNSFLPKRRMN